MAIPRGDGGGGEAYKEKEGGLSAGGGWRGVGHVSLWGPSAPCHLSTHPSAISFVDSNYIALAAELESKSKLRTIVVNYGHNGRAIILVCVYYVFF